MVVQEHLFLVCELLRANLYEFQKYNRDSGNPPYFVLQRVQSIARQACPVPPCMLQSGICSWFLTSVESPCMNRVFLGTGAANGLSDPDGNCCAGSDKPGILTFSWTDPL